MKLDATEGNVLLKNVECTGLGADVTTNTASGVDVTFQFTTIAGLDFSDYHHPSWDIC